MSRKDSALPLGRAESPSCYLLLLVRAGDTRTTPVWEAKGLKQELQSRLGGHSPAGPADPWAGEGRTQGLAGAGHLLGDLSARTLILKNKTQHTTLRAATAQSGGTWSLQDGASTVVGWSS